MLHKCHEFEDLGKEILDNDELFVTFIYLLEQNQDMDFLRKVVRVIYKHEDHLIKDHGVSKNQIKESIQEGKEQHRKILIQQNSHEAKNVELHEISKNVAE